MTSTSESLRHRSGHADSRGSPAPRTVPPCRGQIAADVMTEAYVPQLRSPGGGVEAVQHLRVARRLLRQAKGRPFVAGSGEAGRLDPCERSNSVASPERPRSRFLGRPPRQLRCLPRAAEGDSLGQRVVCRLRPRLRSTGTACSRQVGRGSARRGPVPCLRRGPPCATPGSAPRRPRSSCPPCETPLCHAFEAREELLAGGAVDDPFADDGQTLRVVDRREQAASFPAVSAPNLRAACRRSSARSSAMPSARPRSMPSATPSARAVALRERVIESSPAGCLRGHPSPGRPAPRPVSPVVRAGPR